MRTVRQFILGVFGAGLIMVMGATTGLALDQFGQLIPRADKFVPRDQIALTNHLQAQLALAQFEDREITCLTNIIQSEGGGELVGHRYLIAMIAKARRDDPMGRWGKTLCAIAASGEFSGVKNPHNKLGLLPRNVQIAAFIYRDPWREQVLPRGWECVRHYAVPLEKIKKLSAKRLKQLKITKAMKGYAYFKKELRPVATFGGHEAHEPKVRCKSPLPTT